MPHSINFCDPKNLDELSVFIGIDRAYLEKAISPDKSKIKPTRELPPSRFDVGNDFVPVRTISLPPLFMKFGIPKRKIKGLLQYRRVWAISDKYLADAYKGFARRFDLFAQVAEKRYPHNAAFGFIRGRNILDNANKHCKTKRILHADIKDFFPSISIDRIERLFLDLRLQPETAKILSQFVTVEGTLAQGLSSSPMLANLVCLDMDDKFCALVRNYGCTYTRYADDITISGDDNVPTKHEIEKILNDAGFSLSVKKFYISTPGRPHYVTGLSVDGPRPRAPRCMKRKIRQELYYCEKLGIRAHLNRIEPDDKGDLIRRGVNRIDGTIRYLSYIEKGGFYELRDKWKKLLKREGLGPSYESQEEEYIKTYAIYVDETEFSINTDKYLALAFVLTEDPGSIASTTYGVLNNHMFDPFKDGKKEVLQKKKLHYGDATEDLRGAYVEKLGILPYRGYVAYKKLPSSDEYESCYLSLIRSTLRDRLIGCDGGSVYLVFEENSKIKTKQIQETVEEIFNSLKKTHNRRPISIEISIQSKGEQLCFSVPDFLLAYFSKYARSSVSGNCTEREKLFFERLRDKYRVILDADTNIPYSRRRPFVPFH